MPRLPQHLVAVAGSINRPRRRIDMCRYCKNPAAIMAKLSLTNQHKQTNGQKLNKRAIITWANEIKCTGIIRVEVSCKNESKMT